jgi:hypothetical protein
MRGAVGRPVGRDVLREIPGADQHRIGGTESVRLAEAVQSVDRQRGCVEARAIDLAVVKSAAEGRLARARGMGCHDQCDVLRPTNRARPFCLDDFAAIAAGLRIETACEHCEFSRLGIPGAADERPFTQLQLPLRDRAPSRRRVGDDEFEAAVGVEPESPALFQIVAPARENRLGAAARRSRPDESADDEGSEARERRLVRDDRAGTGMNGLIDEGDVPANGPVELGQFEAGAVRIGIGAAHADQFRLRAREKLARQVEGDRLACGHDERPSVTQDGRRIGHAEASSKDAGSAAPVRASQRRLKTSHSASAIEVKT